MRVIGITGGIGTGKSVVAQYLADLGAVIINADEVGHEALRTDEVKQEIMATFGSEVLSADGEIDRKKLGEIVFNDPDAMSKLNNIMHVRMRTMMENEIDDYRQKGAGVVVVDAAILVEVEADWVSLVDEIWVTVSSESEVIKRLTEKRGLTEEQVLARISAQLPQDERIKRSDVVVSNDGDLVEVKTRVKELWENLEK